MKLSWAPEVKFPLKIESRALMADSKETLACSFLSLSLLFDIGLNYLFGFWQADPIAGIIIVLFLFHERYSVWRESGEEKEEQSVSSNGFDKVL